MTDQLDVTLEVTCKTISSQHSRTSS